MISAQAFDILKQNVTLRSVARKFQKDKDSKPEICFVYHVEFTCLQEGVSCYIVESLLDFPLIDLWNVSLPLPRTSVLHQGHQKGDDHVGRIIDECRTDREGHQNYSFLCAKNFRRIYPLCLLERNLGWKLAKLIIH